jgi:anti-sigma regulatory factor (Ser/Thr protein kinase)
VSAPQRRRFNARLADFGAITAHIHSACAVMTDEERLRIVLVVEELFANTISHGYGGDSDQPVWLTVGVSHGECHLVYEDCAPAYDPFAVVKAGGSEHEVETRRVGGLGILLLVELSSSRSYRRRGTHNIVELRIPHRR